MKAAVGSEGGGGKAVWCKFEVAWLDPCRGRTEDPEGGGW